MCTWILDETKKNMKGIKTFPSSNQHELPPCQKKQYVGVCVNPFTSQGGHTPYGSSWDPKWGFFFFEFELKPTGKDCADPTQHEFQHHIVQARRNPSLNTGLEWSAKPLRHQPNTSNSNSTGCPAKLYPLLFLEFLGFLAVQKFHLGHFSTYIMSSRG